jgi:hypothetical protein
MPALAALFAIAASIGGLFNKYVQDDIPIIWKNPVMHSFAGIGELFTRSYWPPPFIPALYRPFASVSFMGQWAVGGGSPIAFRVVSYLLYAAVAIGVFRVARLTLSPMLALAVAALFAVHPLHVEAVAVAVNQSELWVGLLACVMVLHYVRIRAGGGPITARTQLLLAALYLTACLFKESALVIPGLLVAAEALLVRNGESFRIRVARCRPLHLLLLMVALIFFWVRTEVLSGSLLGTFVAESLVGLDMGERVLTMLAVVPEWFRLMLWPAQLKADYGPSELVGHTAWGPVQTLGLVLLLATVAATVAAWRRAPMISFGLAWFAIGLFPVHNVLAPTGILLAERTLFLPSIGMLLAIGGIAAWILPRVGFPVRRLIAATAALLLVAGLYRSNLRHQVWSDQFTLWYRTANEDAPLSFRAHEALAETYFDIGVERMAEREYRLAIEYAPKTLTRPILAYAERLRSRGFCHRAAELYRQVIAVRPEHLPARASLIACLLDLGYYKPALFHSRMAVTFDWERPVFQLALAAADSALRVEAPPGTVRVAVPTGFNTRGHMMIFDKK